MNALWVYVENTPSVIMQWEVFTAFAWMDLLQMEANASVRLPFRRFNLIAKSKYIFSCSTE